MKKNSSFYRLRSSQNELLNKPLVHSSSPIFILWQWTLDTIYPLPLCMYIVHCTVQPLSFFRTPNLFQLKLPSLPSLPSEYSSLHIVVENRKSKILCHGPFRIPFQSSHALPFLPSWTTCHFSL